MTILLTVILPFFNEQGWIGRTIDSLVAQSDTRFRLILINNGSTDGGRAEAEAHITLLGDRAEIIVCAEPGKIPAMAAGLARVDTPLVAVCDADTRYPPEYVARIIAMFDRAPSASAVMAIDLYNPPQSDAALRRTAFILRKARRFPAKCHAGGYAQAFRTAALRAAGGFDTARWPYVLEDHEIVHRAMRHGPALYHADHVCFPSDRRACRKSVSWTRGERLLYRYVPRWAMDWYFYRFLGPRLAARQCMGIALRAKDWSASSA